MKRQSAAGIADGIKQLDATAPKSDVLVENTC